MSEQKVVFLEGERLYLRPYERTDIPLGQRWMNDPRVRQWLNNRFPMDFMLEEKWFDEQDRKRLRTDLILGIVLKEGDRLIGVIGLHRIEWIHRHAHTGMMIGEPECWGQGYGAQAKELVLRYAFEDLNMHRINSITFGNNERSRKCLLKCGYQEEGRQRQKLWIAGQWVDEIHFGLLESEWRARQARA